MPKPFPEVLTPEKALIFRATHRSNVPWILENGLQCRNSSFRDPGFVAIGNAEIIDRRQRRRVPVDPGGTLADYVPFYFTPYSVMLYNIKTGYSGVQQRPNREIVILVSSLLALEERQVPYVFTDRHAALATANFFRDRVEALRHVDYALLQRRDFTWDDNDPGKKERYQAEALAHRQVPVNALLAVGCYTEAVQREMKATISEAGAKLDAVLRPDWYF